MNSTTRCYRFELIKTGERKRELHMTPIRNLKRELLCTRNILSHSFFQSQPQTPAGLVDRGKTVKNLASLTHTCTHGDGEAHIFHTTVNGTYLLGYTRVMPPSVATNRAKTPSLIKKQKDVSMISMQFRIFPKTTKRN